MNLISYVLYSFISVVAMFFAAIIPQGGQISFKKKLCILIFISSFTLGATIRFGQATTPFVLLGISLILCWKSPYKLNLLINFAFGYLSLVCVDYFVSIMGNYIWGLSIQTIQEKYFLPFGIVYLLLLYCITKLLYYLLNKWLRIRELHVHRSLLFCVVGNLFVCISIFVIGIIWGEKASYPPDIIRLNAFLFFVYFGITSILFTVFYRMARKNEELHASLAQYENLKIYTQEVESLYMDMRAFKHDYIDILLSLKTYIDTQNYDGLNTYFYQNIFTLGESMRRADHRLGVLSNLKIDELKSVLSAKLLYALEKGVNITLEIFDPITEIHMESVDLVRVISIFLNNATEASLETLSKELQLSFIKEDSSVVFILQNSCPPGTPPLHTLCDYGVSTKGDYRGIGLYNARKILDQYPNVMWDMTYSELLFKQQLTIFNEF